VLLEIDNQTMKDEMGIAAFGKRKKLDLAIAELRRPASLSSGASMQFVGQNTSANPNHSHQASVSTGMSLNSPLSSGFNGFNQHGASLTSVETPPHTGEATMTPASSEFPSYALDKVGNEMLTLMDSHLLCRDRKPAHWFLPRVKACCGKEVVVALRNEYPRRVMRQEMLSAR
jgi:hypothetical protein